MRVTRATMKVLVADDSPTTRFALRKNLLDWGYEVVEACDGEEAWSALRGEDPPRIAVLDWMMPDLDGVDIAKRLNDQDGGPFVYTILLTSRTDKQDMVFALENGAHNFQSKPIAPEELRSHVNVGRRLVEADDKLKEYAAEMERLATTDSLTGILSRRHFLELGEREWERARRYKRQTSLLLMDIDHFKTVNDTYGHAAGDTTLQALAEVCLSTLRTNDLFGRLGGEEFAVLLPETPRQTAGEAAERLRQAIGTLVIPSEDHEIRITVSIGAAPLLPEDESIDQALRRADAALYEAKEAGRNRVVAK